MKKIKILQTCERRILDAKGKGDVKKLIEGSVATVDDASAEKLIKLGYAAAV